MAALKGFQNQINKIPQALFSLKNAFTALSLYAMDKFVEGTVNSTVALQNFNNQTGLSIDKLQKWQRAGQLSDISLTADQIASSISNLQKQLTNIRLGQGDPAPFQILSIDAMGKDAFQILEELPEAIKNVDNALAVTQLEKMGLSPKFINVLRQSRTEFNKLGQAKFLSKEQRDNILKLGTAITKFKLDMGLAKDKIVSDMLPAWRSLLSFFTSLFNGFQRLTSWIVKSKDAMVALGMVVGTIFTIMNPWKALIMGIVVALEDLFTFFEGGDSVTGKLFGNLSDITKEIERNKKALEEKGAISYTIDETKNALKYWWDFFTKDTDPSDLGKVLVPEVMNLKEEGKGNFSDLNIKDEAKRTLQPANTSKSVSSSNIFNNEYNINSTADASSVAQNVVSKQQTQLNYAYQDINNGAKI